MEKVVKLLNLTQSDSDGEALSAMRKANALLRQDNKTWDEVILGQSHRRGEKVTRPSRPRAEKSSTSSASEMALNIMFTDLAKSRMPDYERTIVDGFYKYFKKNGSLTEKQFKWFKDIYTQYGGRT